MNIERQYIKQFTNENKISHEDTNKSLDLPENVLSRIQADFRIASVQIKGNVVKIHPHIEKLPDAHSEGDLEVTVLEILRDAEIEGFTVDVILPKGFEDVEREKQPCLDALGREIQPKDIIYTISNWNGQKKVTGGEVLKIVHDEYGQPQVRLFKKDVRREVVVKSPENYLILDKRGM